ncbi:hypothetical protein PUN28_011282 [Cardiocondyla obscurior]|uniref:Bee-milk protein n=1 Tax=Cardiocondyla obscurior TaxID=286306 RepID=A0AAW2FFS5_9HYME
MKYSVFALLILTTITLSYGSVPFKIVHEWNFVDYTWPDATQKQDAINNKIYDPLDCVMYGAAKADDNRVFVTVPLLLGSSVPATLATVSNINGTGGPLLRPYPNWDMHWGRWYNDPNMCNGIVNVRRIDIQCNYLFVLDTGVNGEKQQVCCPKLLIFDLKSDTLVKTICIPYDMAVNQTGCGLLEMPTIYNPSKKCTKDYLNNIIIFMTDTVGSGLIIYDISCEKKVMCRVESKYMKPTDNTFSIANKTFTDEKGSYSAINLGHKELLYCALSSEEIYKIKIEDVLKCPNTEKANKQSKLVLKLAHQSGPLATVGEDILIYSDSPRILGKKFCEKCDDNRVVLAEDDEIIQSVTSTKVSDYLNELTCLTDRYQDFYRGEANLSNKNFYFITMNLSEVVREVNTNTATIVKSWDPWKNKQ